MSGEPQDVSLEEQPGHDVALRYSANEARARDRSLRRFLRRITRRVLAVLLAITAIAGIGVVGVYQLLKDDWQVQRKYRVLVPLYASSQEYLQYMGRSDGRFPASNFQRKVSLDTLYALEAGKSAWFRRNPSKYLKSENFEFYYFPEGYDEASNAGIERGRAIRLDS